MNTGFGTGLRTALIIASLLFGGSIALITILSFLGSTWWLFDYLANYRWQYMWLSLIVAIVYSLTAKGIATAVFIVAAVINGFLIAPLWLGSQPQATGEDSVAVVSVNMYGGSEDPEVTLQWLFDTNADLIIALGVTGDRMRPLIVEGSPYRILAEPDAEDRSGIVIIGKGAYTVQTDTTSRLDTVHTVTVPSGDRTTDVVTTWGHLASSAEDAEALAERLAAVEQAVADATNPVMVIGDLGATRFTQGVRDLLSNTELRDATEGSGYLSTSPVSDLPLIGGWWGIPVDLVLMSPSITPLELVTGPDIGVGHLPVRVVVGPANGS